MCSKMSDCLLEALIAGARYWNCRMIMQSEPVVERIGINKDLRSKTMRVHWRVIVLVAIVGTLVFAGSALGHVRISPKESVAGTTERYTMRVPTERQSPTVRIELEVPGTTTITSIVSASGWKIEEKKDPQGKVSRVTWTGGSIPFAEYKEFVFEAKNPPAETKLEWKVIQIYEDGTRSEWTGPESSRSPASVTTIKAAAPR